MVSIIITLHKNALPLHSHYIQLIHTYSWPQTIRCCRRHRVEVSRCYL